MPSTVIRSFRYDRQRHELHVVFQTGRVYTYLEIPDDVYEGLATALSRGQYFNQHIRGNYAFRRATAEIARRTIAAA
jgi:hypothetical protein